MPIPISSSLIQLNAETFFQEGFELSLDAIIPSIELTGSFSQFESKTQFYIYDYSKTILYSNLNYNSNGSFLQPTIGTSTSTSSISTYNQFELTPSEDIYNQGYSTGKYYAAYNFIDYELRSEALEKEKDGNFEQHPYFIKEISGDRTELRIQNNYLISQQIETSYNEFKDKLDARENVDEFYISFIGNRNFIGINSQLEIPKPGSTDPTSILIKLYAPLPLEFVEEMQLQIITKVGETQVFEVEFIPNIKYIDNLLSLKGPNYNVDIKDRINNSTNFKTLDDLINTNSSQSYYQFNSLQDQKGVFLRKNWGDWNQFVKYSSAEQRLNNFYDKMVSIEAYEAETQELETITGGTTASIEYSSSLNAVSNNINKIISKFDSYEYFLYYVTGSQSWPKYTPTYPYTNYSVSSSAVLNWFGSTDESSAYYNSGKNQIYSSSRYDNNNQDYLYYLIPPFITENSSNNQYIKFVNMIGQAFDEMYLYTEAVEQVRNTNSSLTGSVLPLGLADEVITSLGFDTYSNDFNSVGFNVNGVGIFPATGSGLEYIDRYIDIASGSVINYYDTQQSTLGYVIALADPSFPYPLENSAQEIYKRIFHNMVSLVKRKGTVTGLRQLINIWGVPSTMLRISEFGGKNKDDENDYDLWMNRYSTALTTYNREDEISSTTKASGSVRIPWTPLTSNYYNNAPKPDIAVPDCIQFRFKNQKPISSDSVFSQSLLLKNSIGSTVPSDFGIVLQYSGSQSGSFSGSVIPTDSQYGSMQFVISGSTSEGGLGAGYFETEPITLPFFNNDWWSVQLQRKTHISQSVQNSTLNEYELKVANNIYDGYDGNQIGFQGSSSITMPDNKITSSINEAWNKFSSVNTIKAGVGTLLGGFMNLTTLSGYKSSWVGLNGTGRFMGGGFLGQFQEFRYYKRAMSGSSFNDYVMNPESIQGHADSNTGAGSSYDLLSFRLPLGNELEYNNPNGTASFTTTTENGGNIGVLTFGGQNSTVGSEALGSIHPSLVNKKGSLYTSSFLNMSNYTTQSGYVIVYQGWDGTDTSAVTSSYLSPNTEINYMDQPSAGIRNRIKNKIQVIDGNEYGTTLSPFRTIQQEFEQSSSYTEDLNSLEVGFSFQNEINDDIIATFGHGVVSDAVADPRFISESSDRYPELTRIAEDYFKKYQGYTITDPKYTGLPTVIEQEYDYNRLIKFYETSLFKAIKNYVPARTSLSTGIIVKQHLLERNKTNAVIGMHTNTPIAYTPETGSDSWGYTSQTGFNSVLAQQNLLITSSINMYSLTGSAGGSVNKYNTITDQGEYYEVENDNFSFGPTPINLFPDTSPGTQVETNVFMGTDVNGDIYLQPTKAFSSQVRFNMLFGSTPTSADIKLSATSSKRNGIWDWTWEDNDAQDPPYTSSLNYITVYPDERLYFYISSNESLTMTSMTFRIGESTQFNKPEPSASQQVNWYIDPFTGEWKVDDYQTEFYNGEYSGSNFETLPAQYNPYRIYEDGNDQTPDTELPYCDFTKGGGSLYWTVIDATSIRISSGYSPPSAYEYFTGSFFNLKIGEQYKITYTISNSTNTTGNIIGTVLAGHTAGANTWSYYSSHVNWSNGNHIYYFTATDTHIPGVVDSGGVFNYLAVSNATATITIDSIEGVGMVGPKHFYPRDGFTILPTSSFMFQNSPYNPIINNVSGSRPNSFLFDQDFSPVGPGTTLKEGIPSDYSLLVSSSQLGWEGTATADSLLDYSEVPDSNYTIPSIINPRYVGCLLESADYNFYTGIPSESLAIGKSSQQGIIGLANPPYLLTQNKILYINGETGSWRGDISFGKNAVIDRNPIYFAHFKSSLESKEYFGTTTFNIDQLIQVPFEEILNEQSPIITSSMINGSNENLIPMSSTFMPGRKTTIVYNQSSKTFNNIGGTVLNYTNLGVGSNIINAGGINFKAYQTNELKLDQLSIIQYYNLPIWYSYKDGSVLDTQEVKNPNIETTPNSSSLLLSGSYFGIGKNYIPYEGYSSSYFIPFSSSLNAIAGGSGDPFDTDQTFYTGAPSVIFAFTGSRKDKNNRDVGVLNLRGPSPSAFPGMFYLLSTGAADKIYSVKGPTISLFNSINNLLSLGDINPAITSSNSTDQPQTTAMALPAVYPLIPCSKQILGARHQSWGPGSLPVLDQEQIDNTQNYFRFNLSGSNLTEYRNLGDEKIKIDIGDEIRVSYAYYVNDENTTTLNKTYQDFTVLSYDQCAPVVSTQAISKTAFDGQTNISFSLAVNYYDSSTPPIPTFKSNLPKDGYYNFYSLLSKYETAMYNDDIYMLSGYYGSGNTYGCSGSITGVNSNNEDNGTGIIGITMSVTSNHSNYNDGTSLDFGTNYNMQNGDDDQYNTTMKKIGMANPTVNVPSTTYLTSLGYPLDPGFLFDRVVVSPDPNSLAIPIPMGRIYAMTLRKRVEADDRVVLNAHQPSGSAGALTLSGDGYLIPNDLTNIQQRNVQKIINKLKSENVFTPDSNDLQP